MDKKFSAVDWEYRFLGEVVEVIRKEFYKNTTTETPDEAIERLLKQERISEN